MKKMVDGSCRIHLILQHQTLRILTSNERRLVVGGYPTTTEECTSEATNPGGTTTIGNPDGTDSCPPVQTWACP